MPLHYIALCVFFTVHDRVNVNDGRRILSAVEMYLIVDVIALFVDNSLLVVVIVLAVIAIVAITAAVVFLILYIRLRDAYKRS